MYTIRTESVIWNDHSAVGDPRRNFDATYLIDYGFGSKEQCENMLSLVFPGYADQFALIKLRGFWYAVNMDNYYTHILVTKENLWFTERAFQPCPERIPLAEIGNIDLPVPAFFDGGHKRWQDGIMKDMLMIDEDAEVYIGEIKAKNGSVIFTNVLTIFGLHFFIKEICINTSSYVSHVLSYYYNDRSMQFQEEKILQLRAEGVTHYNFYRDTYSYSAKEEAKKRKVLLEQAEVDLGYVKREEEFPGIKVLRPREINPTVICNGGSYRCGRTVWGRGRY